MNNVRSKTARRLTVVAVVAALAMLAAGSAANAGGRISIAQGPETAVLPTAPFGNTDPSTPETVSFVLRVQNLGGLEARVNAGMPGGFLSVAEFAREFGQSQHKIDALTSYLAQFGIETHVMADGLDVQATGTAGAFDSALAVQQQDFQIPATPGRFGHPGRPPMTIHASKQNPSLPHPIGDIVLAILGLSNYPTQQSNSVPAPVDSSTQGPNTALVPSDFANRYDLSPVYAAHGTGAGVTLGILTLASVDPSVVSRFWSTLGGLSGAQASADRIQLVNIDGGAGPVNERFGSDETTLDAEQSGTLAPDAKVRIYQAPNTDPGFVDLFFRAASDDVADTVSVSWGESETVVKAVTDLGIEDPSFQATFDEAFLEFAAQGQSTFASSGDEGAYDAARDLGSRDLSVDMPSTSPWVTSSGGTTLPGPVTIGATSSNPATAIIPAERTWGWDYLWQLEAQRHPDVGLAGFATNPAFDGGTGGGFSSTEAMPGYQRGVPGTQSFSAVQYLTPDGFSNFLGGNPKSGVSFSFALPWKWDFDATPPTTQGTGSTRATPDLSTDADPETGYLLLYTFGDSNPKTPNPPPTVEQFGGTSFVAPQLNGVAAAIDSALGRRVGFWNPSIYRFAMEGGASPFTPLDTPGTSNDNLFYSGTPGNVFNVGSGLGTPDFGKLLASFGGQRR